MLIHFEELIWTCQEFPLCCFSNTCFGHVIHTEHSELLIGHKLSLINTERESVCYLCLPQQVNGESQPVRTAVLQLQGDKGQGQHGSSELQGHTWDKLQAGEKLSLRGWSASVLCLKIEHALNQSLLHNYGGADLFMLRSNVRVCVCVPAWACGRPGSGRVGVWAGRGVESGSAPTWSPKSQNDTTTPLHGTMGRRRGAGENKIYEYNRSYLEV